MSTLENLFFSPPLAFLVLMYSNRCSLSIKFQHNLVELSMLGRSCFLRAALGALWGKHELNRLFIFSLSNRSFKLWGVFWSFSPQNNWPIHVSVVFFRKSKKKKNCQINVKKEIDCVIALPIYCDHASSLASLTRPNVHSKTMLVNAPMPTLRLVLFCLPDRKSVV